MGALGAESRADESRRLDPPAGPTIPLEGPVTMALPMPARAGAAPLPMPAPMGATGPLDPMPAGGPALAPRPMLPIPEEAPPNPAQSRLKLVARAQSVDRYRSVKCISCPLGKVQAMCMANCSCDIVSKPLSGRVQPLEASHPWTIKPGSDKTSCKGARKANLSLAPEPLLIEQAHTDCIHENPGLVAAGKHTTS